MSAELDMSQYLDLFLQEAEEQLEILESETLKLEDDPSIERLQVIFRAAHTLKGSSRAMGFTRFAELTHEMENVLDQLRNSTLALTTEIADALLACMDTLGQMAESIGAGNGDAVECQMLVRQLGAFAGGTGETSEASSKSGFTSALDPDQAELLKAALVQAPVLRAAVRLAADCVMKFARAYLAISAIEQDGEVLITLPDREGLEEEQFDTDFEIFFQSKSDLAALQARLGEISEVAWFEVAEWSAETSKPAPKKGGKKAPTPVATAPEPEAPTAPTPESEDTRSAGGPSGIKKDTGQTVRVDVARLDNLMNLVGELVIDRTRIAQIGGELAARMHDDTVDALSETVGHIARITGDLQDQIMKARMLPIETVFNRFPRVVRDLAHKLNKDVKLELLGGDTELDRSVIEVIGDPILHILRNSVDHGIETPEERLAAGKPAQGRVVVSAKHQENHIVIEIEDDGKGIDVERLKQKSIEKGLVSKEAAERLTEKEALQFIFASGVSTAKEVSEVSGRGVGMDIVRSNIQRLGGLIDLETNPGQGSRFSLRLPLTLAIIRGLLVEVSGTVYVLPLGSVVETLLVSERDIQSVSRNEVYVIRGLTTPIIRMNRLFVTSRSGSREPSDELFVVVVGLAEQRVGLVVDKLIGEQEVVIKSLSRFCGDVAGVSGATILGDGNVALIVDINGLFDSSRKQ